MNKETADNPEQPDEAPASPRRTRRLRACGRFVGRWLAVVAVGLLGGWVGWLLAPAASTTIGPLELDIEIRPAINAQTYVEMPPFGSISFDLYDAPFAVQATVENVNLEEAETLIQSADALKTLEEEVPSAVIGGLLRAGAWVLVGTLLGAGIAGYLVFRSTTRSLATVTVVVIAIASMGVSAAATARPQSMNEPKFSGLISRAPYIAQQGLDALDRLESYRSGIADIVQSVSTLYTISEQLPTLPKDSDIVTVLHISDIHLNPLAFDVTKELTEQFGVDFIIDTGDITSWGTSYESETLSQIAGLEVPYVFITGNHDSPETAKVVASQPNAIVLDNSVTTVAGITIAGIADPRYLPDDNSGSGSAFAVGKAAVEQAASTLARIIEKYDAEHEDAPVQIAAVHDASRSQPLDGVVPLILSGHMHTRSTTVMEDGTMMMVQGSTGGALATSNGFASVADGDPVQLDATLLYFTKTGDRAGELIAYDEVTVGGLGLASINLQRTIVTGDEDRTDELPSDLPPANQAPSSEATSAPTTESTPQSTRSEPRSAPGPLGRSWSRDLSHRDSLIALFRL